MRPDEFPQFKEYAPSQNGIVPDSTRLPKVLADRGRVSLGIVEESPDSISMGVVLRLQTAGTSENLASINSAVVVKERVLWLYSLSERRDSFT